MKTSDYAYYRCSFPEFNVAQRAVVPWLDKDMNLVIAFNTAVGKCVTSQTRIMLADGTVQSAGKIFSEYGPNRMVRVLSARPGDWKIDTADAFLVERRASKIIQVSTADGGEIGVTPEHPFLCKRPEGLAWIRADGLEQDDFIACAKNLPCVSNGLFVIDRVDALSSLKHGWIREPEWFQACCLILSPQKYGRRKRIAEMLDVPKHRIAGWLDGKGMPCVIAARLIRMTGIEIPQWKVFCGNCQTNFTIPEHLTVDFARFLGIVIADEHLAECYSEVSITSGDRDVLEEVGRLLRDVFRIDSAKMRTQEWRCDFVSVSLSPFAEFLCWMGIPRGKKSDLVTVPSPVWLSENEVIAGFLSGLFAGDGGTSSNIEYGTDSKSLAMSIQTLLLRFGMRSSLRRRWYCGKYRYRIVLCGRRRMAAFQSLIGYRCKRKDSKIDNEISTRCGNNTNVDVTPFALSDLRFEKVKSLRQVDESTLVYDFCVPETHNFIAENMIIHNTAMAECAFAYHLREMPKSKVIYISPFKGISDERLRQWKTDGQFSSYGILLNTGDVGHVERTEYERNRFLIFTSESFDARTRSPNHYGWLSDVRCLVYDEAHLIATNRGGKMEAALIRFAALNPASRLIALSATMTNGIDLAKWMKSLNGKQTKFIQSEWRPSPLVYNFHMVSGNASADKLIDEAIRLARDNRGEKILMFVHSKKIGQQLAAALIRQGVLCDFHNASLSASKRAKLEKAFNDPMSGFDVLVSTSTLAAGVNIGG